MRTGERGEKIRMKQTPENEAMKRSSMIFKIMFAVFALAGWIVNAQDAKKPVEQKVNLTKDEMQILLYMSRGAQFTLDESKIVLPVIAKLDSAAADTSKRVKPIALTATERNVLSVIMDRSELKRKLNGAR